jgi:meso-butanediol dehydrogenase/(S,S)-butanediol dehydrogenase/diacetyl reductase
MRETLWTRAEASAKVRRMELEGKVALVTGAARGIGRAIAIGLAHAGCDVAVADIAQSQDGITVYPLGSDAELAITAGQVRKLGRKCTGIQADVTKAGDVEEMMRAIEDRLGGLDILVANAGIIMAGPVASMNDAQWDRIFEVNVKGVFLCARAAIPRFAKRGGGRIVNIASVAGKTGRAGLAAYCASKAAVISLTQSMAEELGPNQIAVNAICPGYLKTAMFTQVLNPLLAQLYQAPEDEVFEKFVQRQTFLGRGQTPEDIAEATVYLCRAENVTGITLTVAGGGEVH